MGCGATNTGGLIVLAHSNSLSHGRGMGLKAPDDVGSAYLCLSCHDFADGRKGKWSKEMKRSFMERAADKSRRWENEKLQLQG